MTQADIDDPRHQHRQRAARLDHRSADDPAVPRHVCSNYRGIDAARLRRHLIEFLARVTPVGRSPRRDADAASGRPAAAAVRPAAHRLDGGRLCRRCSTPCPRPPTACASAPARSASAPENDLPAMAQRFAPADRFRPSARDQAGRRRARRSTSSTISTATSTWSRCSRSCLPRTASGIARADRVPARSRPSHAGRPRGNQADQSRLYRDRPAARARRTARRHPGYRARALTSALAHQRHDARRAVS